MKRVGILGCGWLGSALLPYLTECGFDVFGTYRERQPNAIEKTYPWHLDLPLEGELKQALLLSEAVVVTVPPQRGLSDADNIAFHKKMAQTIEAINPDIQVVYTSSTSVYGSRTGTCVEHSADFGTRAYGIEKAYHQYFENTTILRFGGLIGPQRNPAYFHKADALISEPLAWVNMTHQLDAIRAIAHVLRLESSGIFNVVSPEHCSRQKFYTAAYEQCQLPAPHFTSDPDTGKRVLSDKIIQRLGFAFEYENPLAMLKEFHTAQL